MFLLQPVLALGLVYSIQQFSGAIFQIVADVRRKKKPTMDVLAAGGRYDNLLAQFRKPGTAPVFQCVVGVSVSFDKILGALLESKETQLPTACDVLVGHTLTVHRRLLNLLTSFLKET